MKTRMNYTAVLVCLSTAFLSSGCLIQELAELRAAMTELHMAEQELELERQNAQMMEESSLEQRRAQIEKETQDRVAKIQEDIKRQQMERENREQERKVAERKAREENAERSRAWKSEAKTVPLSDSVSIELKSIPGPLWVGKYEVTQAQWEAVMGENPSLFKGADHPVERFTRDDCQKFLNALNALPVVKESGLTFRLPSEEEWCLARYAGATGKYGTFADGTEISKDDLDKVAWLKETSDDETHPVGQKEPNAFGLYDMLGNVKELTSTTEILEMAGVVQKLCVARGGCFGNPAVVLLDFDRLPDPEDIQSSTI